MVNFITPPGGHFHQSNLFQGVQSVFSDSGQYAAILRAKYTSCEGRIRHVLAAVMVNSTTPPVDHTHPSNLIQDVQSVFSCKGRMQRFWGQNASVLRAECNRFKAAVLVYSTTQPGRRPH